MASRIAVRPRQLKNGAEIRHLLYPTIVNLKIKTRFSGSSTCLYLNAVKEWTVIHDLNGPLLGSS
jgi:hypothetical protein